MAVIRVIRAKDGDTLCSIGYENGFKNCTKLRAVNPSLANRQVQQGDKVNIPDPTLKKEPGQTEMLHKFKRLGRADRVFVIQDRNQGNILSNVQAELAVSNYVTGRQGVAFAPALWRDHNFFGFDPAASADPDHFKLQVFDRMANENHEPEVKVTLQTQKPVINPRNEIVRWEDMTDPGTKLIDVVCKQIQPDSPWYRSYYQRLVVDAGDQSGRLADGTDPADNRTRQTLVTPPVKDASGQPDRQLEILDLRVVAERPAHDCEIAEPGRCRARAIVGVGKEEQVLRMKVFRITGPGAAANATTDAQVNTMLFQNYRLTLAQANIGVSLVENRIFDVPPPTNMITVSDLLTGGERRATGGATIGATVTLSTGNVTANITTVHNDTPQQTAQRLAAALQAKKVTCRVSPNPPDNQSGNAFGSCDLLCFNHDGSLAPILAVSNAAAEQQQLLHTGAWNNSSCRHGVEYGANEPRYRFVGSMDFRAAVKNYNTEQGHLTVILVNRFAPLTSGTLLGYALIPYRQVTANLRPIREFTMAVFLDNNGAQRRTVLPHEAGHVLLDLIHTTNSTNPEVDWQANPFPNNARLAFSEWMAAFSRESSPPFLHLRMSDDPLRVEFQEVFANLQARTITLGLPPKPSPVRTFRTVSASVLGGLRPLRPVPEPPL